MTGSGRDGHRRGALLLAGLALGAVAGGAGAGEALLRIQQATDISVTPAGDGRLLTDIAGRLWSLPAEGGTATPLGTPGEIARRPRLGPDGATVAYEALVQGRFQVMLMDRDGGNPRAVTSGPANHLGPAWSPDGRRLAFASDRGGDFGIWELALDSGALTQLSFEAGHEFDPAWHPDGRSIAYVRELGGRAALVLRTPGRSPRILVNGDRPIRAPSWRPDGTVITYVATLPEGPRLTMAILSEPVVVKPVGGIESVTAAPATWLDRNRLLYTAEGQIRTREIGAFIGTDIPFEALLSMTPAGEPPVRALPQPGGSQPARGLAGIAPLPGGHAIVSALGDLWEIDAQGTLVRQLTVDAYVDRDPAASADGRRLAFSSDRAETPQVWLMDLGTREIRQLTREHGFAGHPAWSPAGDRVAYLAGNGDGRLELKVADAATAGSVSLAAGLLEPGTPAWSADGMQIGVVQNQQGNPQLLQFPAAGGTPRRVTLPADAVGPGTNDAQWSADGRSLMIASATGIRALPALGNGLVGAEWRPVAAAPADAARWLPGEDAVLFTDRDGLARAAGGQVTRIPVAINWTPATTGGRTVVRASRVFTGTGDGYLLDQDIVIEGQRIVAVQPWAATEADATLIDARGRTVMPGLIDLALRLSDRAGERLGRSLLAYGVTTAQVVGDDGAQLREVAERWQAHAAGPRLLRSPAWCGDGPLPPDDGDGLAHGGLRLCPAAVGRVAELAAPLRDSGAVVWSPSWLAVLSGQAHVVSPGAGPAPLPALAPATEAPSYYQDAVEAVAKSGVVFVPGLAEQGLALLVQQQPDLLAGRQYEALFSAGQRQDQARAWRAAAERLGAAGRSALRLRQRALGRMVANGGRLATASLAPAVPYGLGLQAEIRLLAGIGLAPAEVLQMATSQAARALGLQEELGTVAPGRMADLLVIDGDPLADVAQLLRIQAVMVGGALRPLDALLPTGGI